MINQDALDKWLKVLRDPASKKAKGELESLGLPEYRCCLGHLCYALEVPSRRVDNNLEYGEDRDTSYTQLPEYIARQVGITQDGDFIRDVEYDEVGTFGCLADLNDQTDITPQEIADIIEREAKAGNFHNYV